jgi:hypothetical protein
VRPSCSKAARGERQVLWLTPNGPPWCVQAGAALQIHKKNRQLLCSAALVRGVGVGGGLDNAMPRHAVE